eukprot:4295791-Pleurochrysis_carterae.AAC.2
MQARCSLENPTLVDAARPLRVRIIELHSSDECKAAAMRQDVRVRLAGHQHGSRHFTNCTLHALVRSLGETWPSSGSFASPVKRLSAS